MTAAVPACAVVFDLDGTLVQTRVASWEIFSQVNERHGLGVDSPDEFFALFRGNIFASLASRCRDEAHADEVKHEFLTLLRRDYSPPLVPGMRDVVRRLASQCTLAVMSSNAMAVLRRVLTDNDIAYCFAHVFGGDVAPDKRAAIRAFLADSGSGFGRRCRADYDEGHVHCVPDPSSTVLVTDTAGDVRDAVEVGIRVIGVTWGMHSSDELLEAGVEFVALWPQEVGAHLLGDGAAAPPTGACAVPAGSHTTTAPPGRVRPAPGTWSAMLGSVAGGATSAGATASGTTASPARGGAGAAAAPAADARRERRRDAAARWRDGPAGRNGDRADHQRDQGAGRTNDGGPVARPGPSTELLDALRVICPPR